MTTYQVKLTHATVTAEALRRLGRYVEAVWYKGSRHGYPVRCVGWLEAPDGKPIAHKDVLERNEALNRYAAECIGAMREKVGAWLAEHDNLNHVSHLYHEATISILAAAEAQARAGGRFQAAQLIERRSIVTGNRINDWFNEELAALAEEVDSPTPVSAEELPKEHQDF